MQQKKKKKGTPSSVASVQCGVLLHSVLIDTRLSPLLSVVFLLNVDKRGQTRTDGDGGDGKIWEEGWGRLVPGHTDVRQ
jgi:hypothetical protein